MAGLVPSIAVAHGPQMTPRSHKWFEEAKAAGMRIGVAYLGSTVIDTWADAWQHPIPDDRLKEMIAFGLEFPEAATHRWSLIAGPSPWVPQPEEKSRLKGNPRYSALDILTARKNDGCEPTAPGNAGPGP